MICMKTIVRLFAVCSCAVSMLAACSTVNVKQPAGDKAATLDPEKWEGTWLGADGLRCVAKIADPAKGLLEIRSTSPGDKEEVSYLIVRELKDRLVATVAAKPGEKIPEESGAGFFRIAMADEHVVLFMPRGELFSKAVTNKQIAGTIRKADKSNQIDRDLTVLDKFGSAEVDKLPLAKKGSVLECFDPDPAFVVVREKPPAAKEQGSKSEPNK